MIPFTGTIPDYCLVVNFPIPAEGEPILDQEQEPAGNNHLFPLRGKFFPPPKERKFSPHGPLIRAVTRRTSIITIIQKAKKATGFPPYPGFPVRISLFCPPV
jgi:hypothetical protein